MIPTTLEEANALVLRRIGEAAEEMILGFLIQLRQLMNTPPETIVLRYGPEKTHEDRHHWKHRIDDVIKELSARPEFKNTKFSSVLRTDSRTICNFHDRRVSFRFGSEGGQPAKETQAPKGTSRRQRRKQNSGTPKKDRTIIAELTGGVSLLMDPRHETSVYVF